MPPELCRSSRRQETTQVVRGDLSHQPLIGQTGLVRRACFERVGMVDESLRVCQDWELLLRLGRVYPDRRLQGTYARQRDHDAHISDNADLVARKPADLPPQGLRLAGMRGRWLLRPKCALLFHVRLQARI